MTDHNSNLVPDDEDDPKANSKGNYTEFTCPSCTAYNPVGDGFVVGDEVHCVYCGAEFKVKDKGDGRIKLKEI